MEQHTSVLLALNAGETDFDEDAWVVSLDDGSSRPLSDDTNVEPPLRTLAQRAGGSGDVELQEFTYDDHRYVAATKKLSANEENKQYLITAVNVDSYYDEANSLRTRIWLAAFGLTALCGGVGYLFAKRSLEPARVAMSQQRDFIADAAHEMRTPLAIIRASASHALSRPRDESEYQQSLSEILAATERASSGVGELLELARLDAGQAQPRRAPLRLDLLVEEVASAVRVEGVEIDAAPGDALIVDADYALMQQVVENLTRNAAARATKVSLSTERFATWAVINVVDNGPGFDDAVLPHVFDRFRRGDGRGSSGLGMAIAKGIVLAHEGSIAATNQPDGGASVRILLPIARS